MNDGKNLRTDHYLDYETWQEAYKLLEAKIQYSKEGKNLYQNLPFKSYAKLKDKQRTKLSKKIYYEKRIASNLFYALEKEFYWHDFSLPKPGIGIRKHTFFSLPMLTVYYAIGLYLFRLSSQLIEDVKADNKELLHSFYGGNLTWGKTGISTDYYKNLHYAAEYRAFKEKIAEEKEGAPSKYRIIIELDIQNYFENAHIDILLRNLETFVKPSDKRRLNFDASTKESIRFFFQFINKGTPVIVQSYQNIISGFLGYLYLLFGDMIIMDCILKMDPEKKIIQGHKVIRYVDDTFLSLTFTQGLSAKKKKYFILKLLNSLAERYYTELNLRFNKKFGLYFLDNEKDIKMLASRIKKPSLVFVQEDDEMVEETLPSEKKKKATKKKVNIKKQNLDQATIVSLKDETKKSSGSNNPKEKVIILYKLLRRIKTKGVDFLYDSFAGKIENYQEEVDEVLKYIYDSNIGNLFKSEKNQQKLEQVLDAFPFEVFRLNSKAFTVLISKTSKAASQYRRFLLNTQEVTIFEAALIHEYLTQIELNDQELLKKLMQNPQWKPLVKAYNKGLIYRTKDYCKVPRKAIYFFESDINIMEQIRMRRHHENIQEYTVALNHLLNELHSICRALDLDAGSGKDYNVNKVVAFLNRNQVFNHQRIGVRNLFDRRNKNPISHPGEDKLAAWAVTREEYLNYKKLVMDCLQHLIIEQGGNRDTK